MKTNRQIERQQIDSWIDKQLNKYADTQIHMQIYQKVDRQIDNWIDSQLEKYIEIQKERKIDR